MMGSGAARIFAPLHRGCTLQCAALALQRPGSCCSVDIADGCPCLGVQEMHGRLRFARFAVGEEATGRRAIELL